MGAKEARLSVMVGGDEEAVTAVKPLFEVVGKNIVHLGPASSGTSSHCNVIVLLFVGLTDRSP